MSRFLTLISIENTKMWKRISTRVMLFIMIFIVIAASSIYRYRLYIVGANLNATPAVSASWQTDLQKEITDAKAEIKHADSGTNNASERSRVGELQKTIAEDQYRLDNNISQQEPNSIWTKITDFSTSAGYGSLIALLLIIACAAAVAGEFSEGTIKMAISRPYHRHEILSAKLIASLLYGITLMAATLVTNFIMFAIFFGMNGVDAKEMLWTTGQVLYVPAVLKMLALYGLDFLQVIFYTVLAFALSAITRSRSMATGFSLFMLLAGSSIAQMVAVYFDWARYFPLTMTNFSYFMTHGAVLEGTTLPLALALSGIYTLIIGAAGYVVFAKRDI